MFWQRKKAELVVFRINEHLQTIVLKGNFYQIGRKENLKRDSKKEYIFKNGKNLNIIDELSTARISRKHATLKWDKKTKRYMIKDISSYGTTINTKKIPEEIELQNRDVIGIGILRIQVLYR